MLYIQVDVTLIDHPKIKKLARLLSVPRMTAVGHLVALWSWATQYAPDGDLTNYREEPGGIADGAQWDGDAAFFVGALINAKVGNGHGFLEDGIDGSLLIHDWDQYFGKVVERRAADAERQRLKREADRMRLAWQADQLRMSQDAQEDVRVTSNGHPMDSARISSVNVAYRSVAQPSVTEPSVAQPVHAQTASAPTFEAFLQARGGAINSMDGEQLGELEALYGAETTVRAIEWCNKHRKQPFLSIGYIASALAGWQKDGKLGGNGRKPRPPITHIIDPLTGATIEVKCES
jgi:hypothetical protein